MIRYRILISKEEVSEVVRWGFRRHYEEDIFKIVLPENDVDIKKVMQVIVEKGGEK